MLPSHSQDMIARQDTPLFVTLGMFIIDEFQLLDDAGRATGKIFDPQENIISRRRAIYLTDQILQIGGGGTYAVIGARIWLTPDKLGMVVDKGIDFPEVFHSTLMDYGDQMWLFRDRAGGVTTRALNSYRGDKRDFQYLTTKIRVTIRDLVGTRLERPKMLHFICSPIRASAILSETHEIVGWHPITVYEPIPDLCVPSQLPALIQILPGISVLSPNAEEALSFLSFPLPPTKETIEAAADKFLTYNINGGSGWVIIRSGAMGAYAKSRETRGRWISAFWTSNDASRVVDVTGAGNAFLGGLAAGLCMTTDVLEATLYASVSASFVIEQNGPPIPSPDGLWNGDSPQRRLEVLRKQVQF